jgi:hypothetical protein
LRLTIIFNSLSGGVSDSEEHFEVRSAGADLLQRNGLRRIQNGETMEAL